MSKYAPIWNKKMDDILRDMYPTSCSIEEICIATGVGSQTIYDRASYLKIIEKEEWTKDQLDYIRQNYSDIGLFACAKNINKGIRSTRYMAKKLNCTVSNYCHKPISVIMLVDGKELHSVQYGRNSVGCSLMHMTALFRSKYYDKNVSIHLSKNGIILKKIFQNEIQKTNSTSML